MERGVGEDGNDSTLNAILDIQNAQDTEKQHPSSPLKKFRAENHKKSKVSLENRIDERKKKNQREKLKKELNLSGGRFQGKDNRKIQKKIDKKAEQIGVRRHGDDWIQNTGRHMGNRQRDEKEHSLKKARPSFQLEDDFIFDSTTPEQQHASIAKKIISKKSTERRTNLTRLRK